MSFVSIEGFINWFKSNVFTTSSTGQEGIAMINVADQPSTVHKVFVAPGDDTGTPYVTGCVGKIKEIYEWASGAGDGDPYTLTTFYYQSTDKPTTATSIIVTEGTLVAGNPPLNLIP